MNRLTFKEDNRVWGIIGMNEDNENEKMYAVASKLLDYEETGLTPEEVQRVNDITNSQLPSVMKELQRYKELYGELN